jgi:alpha-tubulin suppressor-like RCC1 family protein
VRFVLLFTILASLFACGGSGSGVVPIVNPTPTLVSITISSNQVFVGSNRQFTASGLFSDGTNTDVTTSVLWSSNTPSVATVTPAGGLVAGVAAGQATIIASFNLISDHAALNVSYPWVFASAGSGYSVALKSDGSLWTWGYSVNGQLGESGRANTKIPVRVGTDTWLAVSAGIKHVLAIKSDGTLWAWGDNDKGQLGNGYYGITYNLLQKISSDTTWVSVSAGDSHSHAIKSDGTLWAWGRNYWGELGDGFTADKYVPTKIGAATDWATVSAGAYHCVGLKKDGSLWAWGDNVWGQRGDNTTDLKPTQGPTQIGAATGWLSARAEWAHSYAIKSDSTLWAWGNSLPGTFGNGTSLSSNPTPTQIGSSTYLAAAPGYNHSLAVKSNGSLWGCGSNEYGQTGTQSSSTLLYLTKVGSDSSWLSVSASMVHSLAIKSDGSLWAWGDNIDGELGDGSTLKKDKPVQVVY